ncbi:MAG TPA: hypothetical protein VNN55_09520 [bacterium]|nr:hypothetical protein [bacterium]
MLKGLMDQVGGGDGFGLVALLVLLAAFVAIIIWTYRIDRRHVERMSRMPLEPDSCGNTVDGSDR